MIIVQHQFWGDFCPCDMSHEVQPVTGTKSPQNWCCTIIKVSAHMRGHVTATYPWDMYPQHFHVCAHVVILSLLPCSHYTTLMHVASVWTTHLLRRSHDQIELKNLLSSEKKAKSCLCHWVQFSQSSLKTLQFPMRPYTTPNAPL